MRQTYVMNKTTKNKETEFEALMAANKGVIAKVCYMYAANNEHFKDLYQETLINIWQSFDKFRGESAVSTWIYRITINTCISCFRHTKKYANTTSMAPNELLAVADSPTDDHEHNACLREMYKLINALPALDKALILMWLDEKSYQEIAEVTGLSRTNVAAKLNRCKQRLARMSNS